jgi:hypothetical protein
MVGGGGAYCRKSRVILLLGETDGEGKLAVDGWRGCWCISSMGPGLERCRSKKGIDNRVGGGVMWWIVGGAAEYRGSIWSGGGLSSGVNEFLCRCWYICNYFYHVVLTDLSEKYSSPIHPLKSLSLDKPIGPAALPPKDRQT